MGMMESTWYLPNEKLHYRNYPEVNALGSDIDKLLLYAMRIMNALDYYNNGVYDKIDVDIIDLQKHIALCRTISEALGKAPNVCFDLLIELRNLQSIMQQILFIRNRYGNQYVGTPTTSTNDANTIG